MQKKQSRFQKSGKKGQKVYRISGIPKNLKTQLEKKSAKTYFSKMPITRIKFVYFWPNNVVQNFRYFPRFLDIIFIYFSYQ